MAESKSKVLPSFQSTTDLVEFFETHDIGDYWSDLPAADFEVEFEKGRRLIPMQNDLMDKIPVPLAGKRPTTTAHPHP